METNQHSHRNRWAIILHRWFAYLLLQYELITCTCMFEPWEKVFINGLIFGVFGLILYSSWVYLPQYLLSLLAWMPAGLVTQSMTDEL